MLINVKRPNFFIVGAPKSGTSALSQYIDEHPNGFLCAWKEPNYFSTDFPSHRLARTEKQYLSLYARARDHHQAVGEASVWYLYSETAARNIHRFDPDARIVIMLRNPVQMIRSLHTQMVRDFAETEEDFERALDLEPQRRAGKLPERRYKVYDPSTYLYTDVGKYAHQVRRYYNVFPAEQIKVIIFDDFVADTKAVYEESLQFLGLPPDGRTHFPRVNPAETYRWPRLARLMFDFWQTASSIKRRLDIVYPLGIWPMLRWFSVEPAAPEAMPAALRERLSDVFRDDVRELSQMLGRDLTHWTGDARVELDPQADLPTGGADGAATTPDADVGAVEPKAALPAGTPEGRRKQSCTSTESERPLRVIYTMAEDIGGQKGSSQHYRSVVEGLQTCGHEVFVVAPSFRLPRNRRELGDANLFIRLAPVRMMFLVFQVLLMAALPAVALLWQPDAIMIRALPGAYWTVALLAKLLGIRVVVEVNGIPWEEMHSRGLPRPAKWVAHCTMRLLCRCADTVVSVTPGISRELQRMTGMRPSRFVTVQNATDARRIQGGDGHAIRKRLGIADDAFVVGFVGTFDIWHGTQELVASAEHLSPERRDTVVYLLAGDGECRPATEAAAERCDGRFIFPGAIPHEEVKHWLAAFDLGVFVSHDRRKCQYGTSPLKFWEYLAAGLPVLVTRDPNLSAIVTHHDMGFVIDEASPASIAHAVDLAYRQRERLVDVGRRNAEWVACHGTWHRACQRLEGILRDGLAPPSP
ncbi:MAG: glycosyltransferase [Planctomycetes bacterium]|nr:glycosyltransferase [Phycisphaerae bacterium]NBB95561.1 glycosyltransferase [Planctomycetota bacterium]